MIKFDYKIEGLDDFLKKVGQMAFEKSLNKSIKKSIFTVERSAKINNPVDTGLLRNSYQTDFKPLYGEIRNYREYAEKREFENFKNPQTKFYMTRAVNDNRDNIGKIFENDLIDLLEFLTNE